jgi:hypothetical protein
MKMPHHEAKRPKNSQATQTGRSRCKLLGEEEVSLVSCSEQFVCQARIVRALEERIPSGKTAIVSP